MANPMSLQGLTILRPQLVMDWVIERLQGEMVSSSFLPVTTSNSDTFKYFLKGIVGGQTGRTGENDPGELITTEYEQRSARTEYFRERTAVSLYTSGINIFDVAQDNIGYLGERGGLRLETLRLNAIFNAAKTQAKYKNKFYVDLSEDGRSWIGGVGGVSPIDDIIDGHHSISKYGRMHTDTLLCGTRIGAALQKNIETKNWDRVGPIAQERVREGTMLGIEQPMSMGNPANRGRLAGHEVFVTNAVVLEDESDNHSDLIPILENDVYLFKRGERLGRMVFFENPQVLDLGIKKETRTQEWQFSFAAVPVIYRPQLIYKIQNAIAPGA